MSETIRWSRPRDASHSRHGIAFWLVWLGVYGWLAWTIGSVIVAAVRHLGAMASAAGTVRP